MYAEVGESQAVEDFNIRQNRSYVPSTRNFTISRNSCYVPTTRPPSNSRGEGRSEGKSIKKLLLMLSLVVLVLMLGPICACVAFAHEIVILKSNILKTNTSLNLQLQAKSSELSASFQQQLNASHTSLNEQIQQLKISSNSVNATQGKGRHANNPAASCAVLTPFSPSGYYWISASNGSAVRVYCDMTRLCGGVTGVWTRVAYFNRTASSQQCFNQGLIPQTLSGELTCAITNDDAGCSSVNYTTFLPYSKICGKILANSTATPDGFGMEVRSGNLTLDSNYVDGVSLTHGKPRQHIWTFAADRVKQNCRCENSPPSFINNEHYFCADRDRNPAWDGMNGCLTNNPPWFHRELSALTTNDIEMRVCRDQGRSDNEDIGITHIELYVQ